MKKIIRKTALSLVCSLALSTSPVAFAADGFTVKKIEVTGLQRIKTGTVLNYLPVQVGEHVGPDSTSKIIHSLYETGFFQSVVLERQGNTLIVNVVERPTIGSINVTGNKEIPSDKLKEILKEMGLSKGQVYQTAALEKLEKELRQAYNARGKYNARIESQVSDLTENRVAITVTISEGRVSLIKDIKIIGNHDFTDKELLSQLALSKRHLTTYFSKKDQYTKAAMDASLEALRSFYLDRGYLKFKIISSQVLLSPDKKDVFINIHIEEGPRYYFSGYDIVGKTALPESKVRALIRVKDGAVFSRQKITESISSISEELGNIGYGFPAINAEPRVDEKAHTVFIVFSINPGRHVYVRRINFHGNTKTGDYVLRNIIRQDEGSLLSLHNVKESERQLRVLNYLKNINVKTTPVPDANNQVDLDISVEEAPSAEATASLGYGTTGPQFNASFQQYNFMGTGRTVGLSFNASYWGQDYSLNYYNPFYTNTGVGRGVNLYFQRVDPTKLDVSTYSSNRFGGDVTYNFLLSEKSSMQLGYGYQGLRIKSAGPVSQIQNFITQNGRDFDEIRLSGGWSRNSYDQMPYPTRGTNQQAGIMVAIPANSRSLDYYKASYQARLYQPLAHGLIFTIMGNVGYGDSFSGGTGLPFFENYYAGGITQPGQVRGYASFSLGPLDNFGNALGGNFLLNGSAGIILPYPLSRDTVRTSVFADAGNVYARGTPAQFTGGFTGPMRYSAGVSVEWRSPFGPLAFSYAKPINKQPFDDEQNFQFTLSSSF